MLGCHGGRLGQTVVGLQCLAKSLDFLLEASEGSELGEHCWDFALSMSLPQQGLRGIFRETGGRGDSLKTVQAGHFGGLK